MLSKQSREVERATGIGVDLSRLVGEYIGTDLPLLPGECFYDIELGGYSFVKMAQDFGLYSGIIGKNIHVNEWVVKRRTPQSYVVKYRQTSVICETDFGLTYKYYAVLKEHVNRVRRIFPFRRKLQPNQHILEELEERKYDVLACTSKARTNGDFFLHFSEINGK